jgi:predicted DNA repair protein MutK
VVIPTLFNAAIGVIAGIIVLLMVTGIKRVM